MGFFGKLFGRSQPVELEVLNESIKGLRIGIFAYLFKKKYVTIFGEEEAKFWAAAVLNTMTLEEPGNEQARVFYERNKEKILQEAFNVNKDKDLFAAASYLYAAQTIYLSVMTKNPFSQRAQELGEQATRLGISTPNAYDICGSNDIKECIYSIDRFAKDFLNKHASTKFKVNGN